MLTKLIPQHRISQIQKTLNKLTLTLACLLLTIIMIRSMLGAGDFGTPEHDFHLLHSTFTTTTASISTRRLLLHQSEAAAADLVDKYKDNYYNSLDVSNNLEEKDQNAPFTTTDTAVLVDNRILSPQLPASFKDNYYNSLDISNNLVEKDQNAPFTTTDTAQLPDFIKNKYSSLDMSNTLPGEKDQNAPLINPRRLLESENKYNSLDISEEKDQNAPSHLTSFNNSYNSLDISNILKDDKPQPERDPNVPFSLGSKILDWDRQRINWLNENPGFPNFVQPGKPRVLLVTGSSPKPCENPVGDHYLLKSLKNKIDYCRIHGIEIFYNFALLDAEMSGFWAKLPLVRKLLLSHPEIEFLWWMDSDAMFTDMVFELPWEKYLNYNMIMHGWDKKVYEEKDWVGLNTGSFLLRNNQWSLDLLDVWAPMGPKGKVRDEAGAVLTRELKGRPVFEADDQSAIVYILATEREKWGSKVYLENDFYLHGYWGMIVDRYEEMLEKYKAGMGDHRWPLVTHFVGCKPCNKFGDYPVERCLKSMDRAFNFGDNQVLQMYGFSHKSLASRRVTRIRNETSNPFDVVDELGLLHPRFKSVKV